MGVWALHTGTVSHTRWQEGPYHCHLVWDIAYCGLLSMREKNIFSIFGTLFIRHLIAKIINIYRWQTTTFVCRGKWWQFRTAPKMTCMFRHIKKLHFYLVIRYGMSAKVAMFVGNSHHKLVTCYLHGVCMIHMHHDSPWIKSLLDSGITTF